MVWRLMVTSLPQPKPSLMSFPCHLTELFVSAQAVQAAWLLLVVYTVPGKQAPLLTVVWTVLLILFIMVIPPTHASPENKILVKQSPLLVVDSNEVSLSCRYSYNLLAKEFRASLYKGVNSDVEVCVGNGNFTYQPQFRSNAEFNCDGDFDNETVTFRLWNLHVNHTDIYFCKIEFMYPPPYLDNERSNGTIIHIKEKHLCHTQSSPKLFWALVVVAGVLFCYGLLVTVALCVIWTNSRRNRLLQSDYMNMTPRRPGLTRKPYQPYAPARDFAAYRP